MTRKKVHLTKYLKRRSSAYRDKLSGNNHMKRSRDVTSYQSPFKSPFRSPCSTISPACKKLKSDNHQQQKSQSKSPSPFRQSTYKVKTLHSHGKISFKSPFKSLFRTMKRPLTVQKKINSARSLFGKEVASELEANFLESDIERTDI